MKKAYNVVMLLLVLVLLLPFVSAVGSMDGETVLDTVSNYASTNYRAGIENGLLLSPFGVVNIKLFSTLANTLGIQYNNKANALNQNVDLDVAKNNLENSKTYVSNMFFFIVGTFVVMFDLIISIIYIAILSLTIWVIFVGYVKLMIMVIDFVHGRYKIYKGLR